MNLTPVKIKSISGDVYAPVVWRSEISPIAVTKSFLFSSAVTGDVFGDDHFITHTLTGYKICKRLFNLQQAIEIAQKLEKHNAFFEISSKCEMLPSTEKKIKIALGDAILCVLGDAIV